MRRPLLAFAVVAALLGGSAVVASVTSIDGAAEVDRTAYRLSPPFRPDIDAHERVALEMVELINLERNRRGLPRYYQHEAVSAAAMTHAADMAAIEAMVHIGSDGSDTGDRLVREGFAWQNWGEAIGAGFTTPEPLFDAWMDSAAHRPHLLSENLYLGIGVRATAAGVPYWVLVVAS